MIEELYNEALEAQKRIYPPVQVTPLNASQALSEATGGQVNLKLDFTQQTGSFKLRGGANFIQSLSPKDRQRGVVVVSTGNHGRAVSLAGRMTGTPVTVFLSHQVPQNKVDALRELGAEVNIRGHSYDEAFEAAQKLAQEDSRPLIPPFDDQKILAGQATLGLELLQQAPECTEIIVPVSGGGLAAGLIIPFKKLRPDVRIIGVTMENGPAMYNSLKAGNPVPVEETPTLADSLMGGIGLENQYTFELMQKYLDEYFLVSEEEIKNGLRHAFLRENLIVEGSAAASIAGLFKALENRVELNHTVLILSGRNIAPQRLLEILNEDTASD